MAYYSNYSGYPRYYRRSPLARLFSCLVFIIFLMMILFLLPNSYFGYYSYWPVFTIFIIAIIASGVISIVSAVARKKTFMRAQQFPQDQQPSQDDFARINGLFQPNRSQQGAPDSTTQVPPTPGFKSERPRGPTLDTKWQTSAVGPVPAQRARYCPVCGFEMGTDASFCPNCGAERSQFSL